MNNVTREGSLDWLSTRRVPRSAAPVQNYLLRDGDVLFNNTNSPNLVGKTAVFRDAPEPVVFSNHFLRIRPRPDALDGGFLARWLHSVWQEGFFELRCSQWVNQATFRREDLLSLRIPHLPLPEQHRIAAILDKAEALRRKREEALQLSLELVRSVFMDMFGDPVSNPRGWRTLTLGALAPDRGLIVDGPFGSSMKPDSYVAAGVRVIRNFNIHDDWFDGSSFKFVAEKKFQEVRRSEVRAGDILVSTKGTIGNVCIMPSLPGPSVLSATGTVRVRFSTQQSLLSEFAVAQMILPRYKLYLKSFQAGSNQKYLNLAAIRRLELIEPPLEMQRRFLAMRSEAARLRSHSVAAHLASEDLFVSLLDRAFRGEI